MSVHLSTIPVVINSVVITELVPRIAKKLSLDALTADQKACFEPLNAALLQAEQQLLQDVLVLQQQMASQSQFDPKDLHYSASVAFHLHKEDAYFSDDSDNLLCVMSLDFVVENKQHWPAEELAFQKTLNPELTLEKDSAVLLDSDPLLMHFALAEPPHSVLLHYLFKEVISYRNAHNPGRLGLLDLLRIDTLSYDIFIQLGLAAPLNLRYPKSLKPFTNQVSAYQPSEKPRYNHASFRARTNEALDNY